MSELRDLYQEVILDHNRNPRNFKVLKGATCKADGYNPLCGDRLTLYLKVEGDTIVAASFEGTGCAISKASASLLTDIVKGKSVAEAEALFARFHQMVTSPPDSTEDFSDLGKLFVLAGVREFPVRVKCASLAWHTLRSAVDAQVQGEPATVTTEEPGERA